MVHPQLSVHKSELVQWSEKPPTAARRSDESRRTRDSLFSVSFFTFFLTIFSSR